MKKRVKKARTQLGLTQGRLAAMLGVHPITLSRWERGLSLPPPYNHQQLAALEAGTLMLTKADRVAFDELIALGRFVEALGLVVDAGRRFSR